jgi:hypothetical protein
MTSCAGLHSDCGVAAEYRVRRTRDDILAVKREAHAALT